MDIVAAQGGDWEAFLALAHREGWRVPDSEPAWFRASAAGRAYALREDEDFRGFVTAAAYQQSGWIGNLLVPAGCRGRGYGARLFSHAMEVLQDQGISRLWLTASDQGRPLYLRHGFREVGRVVRWRGRGAPVPATTGTRGEPERLLEADTRAWGESRQALLGPLAAAGQVLAAGETVLLLQAAGGCQVLGPWYSAQFCPRENRQVLAAALAAAGPGDLVADVLAASPVAPLLAVAGFRRLGDCALMVRGPSAITPPRGLVSLASLGSLG